MIRLNALILLLLIPISLYGSHKIYLIHGFGGFQFTMNKIEKSIKNERYQTVNYGYKSFNDLDTIGKQLYLQIKNSNVDTISFVTHSMGALLVRSMLQYSANDKYFPKIFRIIMIAPPNRGTEIADFYSSFGIVNYFFGQNVKYMKTDSDSYANRLPKPYDSEIGIIAGIRGKKHGYNLFLNGDNDGGIKPEKTKIGIEKDYITVIGQHNFLLMKKYVSKLVIEFLKYGSFISKQTPK
jgi:hypothetical protein